MIKIKIIISIALLLYCSSSISAISPRSSFIHYPIVLIAPQQTDSANLPPIVQPLDKNPFLQKKLKSPVDDQVITQQQQAPQHSMYEKLTTSPVIITTVSDCFQLFCCAPSFTRNRYGLHHLISCGFFNDPGLCRQIIDEFAIQDITAKQTNITLIIKDYYLFNPVTFDHIVSITFNSNDMQQIYTIAKETLEARDENRFVR